mmetsp:Transcript_12970/g.34722  ORF Transcript_12970/g.34722 Transcript_12970/m.34722 type:complete len:258 (+) Transcript_12970:83-856(+)
MACEQPGGDAATKIDAVLRDRRILSTASSLLSRPRDCVPASGDARRVFLNVYDLGTNVIFGACNSTLVKLGAGGVFHVAIQVWGREWSYGHLQKGCGIGACAPRADKTHVFRESVDLGIAQCSQRQFIKNLKNVAHEWMGPGYSLIHRNCCHFAQTLTEMLGVDPIPGWVDSLGQTADRVLTPLELYLGVEVSDAFGHMTGFSVASLSVLMFLGDDSRDLNVDVPTEGTEASMNLQTPGELANKHAVHGRTTKIVSV